MTKRHAGYYGIIQFFASRDRSEGINVGIYVGCPSLGEFRVKMSEVNDRVRHRLGAAFDDRRLSADKRALRVRLEGSGFASDADIVRFISRESGALMLTQPRPIAVISIESDVANLYTELVGDIPRRRRARAEPPDISDLFDPIRIGAPVLRNQTVVIPTLNQKIVAPFAYLNKSMNYIKPHGFSDNEGAAIQSATHLGVQGQLLYNHLFEYEGETVGQRLIVVASFAKQKMTKTIIDLLEEFKVRVVPANDIHAFVDEVREHARRPRPAAE